MENNPRIVLVSTSLKWPAMATILSQISLQNLWYIKDCVEDYVYVAENLWMWGQWLAEQERVTTRPENVLCKHV